MTENYLRAKSISPQSKKIRKSVPKLHKNLGSKTYETFDPTKRELIILDLKKILLQEEEMIYNLSPDQFIKLLEGLDLEFYRKILAKVLISHIPSIDTSNTELAKWRRKLKGWIKSTEKPENRGSHLVSHDQSEEFKQEIIIILGGLLFRSFPLLQSRALKALEKYQNKSSLVDENESAVCSKHWWFDFVRKYPDVKEMWESLPLEKSYKAGKPSSGKKKPGYSHNASTTDSSPLRVYSPQTSQSQIQENIVQPQNDDSTFSCFAPESPSHFLQKFDEEETQNLDHEFQMPLFQIYEIKEIYLTFK